MSQTMKPTLQDVIRAINNSNSRRLGKLIRVSIVIDELVNEGFDREEVERFIRNAFYEGKLDLQLGQGEGIPIEGRTLHWIGYFQELPKQPAPPPKKRAKIYTHEAIYKQALAKYKSSPGGFIDSQGTVSLLTSDLGIPIDALLPFEASGIVTFEGDRTTKTPRYFIAILKPKKKAKRKKRRMITKKKKTDKISSSWVAELLYNLEEMKVWATFNARKYTFYNVPSFVFNAWWEGAATCITNDKEKRWYIGKTPSLGAFFNANILNPRTGKSRYSWVRGYV